jgi:uncharacterized protein (DUF2236 family)
MFDIWPRFAEFLSHFGRVPRSKKTRTARLVIVQNTANQGRALTQLLALLAGTPAGVQSQGLLLDRSPDPGLFGPVSITWRVVREPLLLLSGSRALLMQLAHPLVAQAVIDHSEFETNPFGRLLATVRWVSVFVFGTTGEALGAVEALRSLHARIAGTLGAANATARMQAGRPYSALDPVLDRWVYATLLDSMLVAHDALIGTLSLNQSDRLVREWAQVAHLVDADLGPRWESRGDLRRYIDEQIQSGEVTAVPATLQAARTVLHPPLPSPALAPLSWLIALVSTGLLPDGIRHGLGLRRSSRDQAMLNFVSLASRAAHPLLPRRLRVSPLYDLARSRLA